MQFIFASDLVKFFQVMQFAPHVLISTQWTWYSSRCQQMSERWRVFVWRSARCEPHMLYVSCVMLQSPCNVSWGNGKYVLFGIIFSSNFPVILCKNDGKVCFLSVCVVSFSPLSALAASDTTPVDMFFTYDLLWISNLQCSDCYRPSKPDWPLHCLKVWHLHSMLLS